MGLYLWDRVLHTVCRPGLRSPAPRTIRGCRSERRNPLSPRNYLQTTRETFRLQENTNQHVLICRQTSSPAGGFTCNTHCGLQGAPAGSEHKGLILTGAGLHTHGSVGVLGVGVVDDQLGFFVVDNFGRTGFFTGSIIVKTPAGLQRKQTEGS